MKISNDELLYMRAFENITGVNAMACVISGNSVNFLVGSGKVGLAVGKNGVKVKELKNRTGKNIQIFEYEANAENFVRKAFCDAKIEEIKTDASKRMVISADIGEKKKILQNLGKFKNVREILKKSYDINDLKIR